MSKVAVVFAPGFEEIEGLTIVDVLRRAEMDVTMVGFDKEVTGNHNITVKSDQLLSEDLKNYDMIVLPGGTQGANNLKNNPTVIESLQTAYNNGKQIGAICAAPMVLEEAGLLQDKNYTSFPGIEDDIKSGNHSEMLVVKDGRVTTSRGPATALAFSYRLVDILGGNSDEVKEAMQYNKLAASFLEK
ncbi:DJ-1/PfpI family protein [Tetragenococcus koreensis]|uniref:4-methyl-5(B-hydroxyethyl)-thiazole monophosphate biosynthesis protein n=1 Tax=Tetragenococcus koreensis TaxID=290335 RepID=A0AAN4RJT4_9ENTE|nr:DJ-1 family glyoxalase III [Tetragenococcus koreensis]AYW45672.1 DJ-1 family protein [Tetragenococcus koreensis]MCF1584844.1 DJ-1/PfpI family protein [Tetragenococcus koreensis]MCF1614408.1 DJ-1/PfpI family protein [Tetragenococcus koreensis]MCF1617016.1 DJ-1/PfpI family protein [Tetragenococcus koreensis]MCF1619902.1 DJ-1/PfpI family protein [Tetragenococcus koreensis]